MRRKIVVIFLAALAVFFLTKPAILFVARIQLQGVFPGSKVSIKSCSFIPHRLLFLSEIEIRRDKVYDFKIKEAKVFYDPIRLLRRKIVKFYLGEAAISINMGKESIAEFSKYVKLGPSIFLLESVELHDLNLDLKSKEAVMTAGISSEFNPLDQSINYFDLKIGSLEAQGAQVKNASLRFNQKRLGNLYIERIQYDKAKIEDVKGSTYLEGKSFAISSLSAKTFDGQIHGELKLRMDKTPEYFCNLKFIDLDLDRFAQDFKLKEKFRVTGRLTGDLALQGSGANVKILGGNFNSVEPGGMLTITDDKFLNNVAKSSGQSLDILVESFKDYHYNTGVMKLSLEQGDIVFDIALEGESGKRNLSIVLHDFKLGSLATGN